MNARCARGLLDKKIIHVYNFSIDEGLFTKYIINILREHSLAINVAVVVLRSSVEFASRPQRFTQFVRFS